MRVSLRPCPLSRVPCAGTCFHAQLLELGVQVFVVGLDREDIVGALGPDGGGGVGLSVHRVEGDHGHGDQRGPWVASSTGFAWARHTLKDLEKVVLAGDGFDEELAGMRRWHTRACSSDRWQREELPSNRVEHTRFCLFALRGRRSHSYHPTLPEHWDQGLFCASGPWEGSSLGSAGGS